MFLVKMGVGGFSAETIEGVKALVAETDQIVRQYEGLGLGETVDREVALIRRGCARLELKLWQTSPTFCKSR